MLLRCPVAFWGVVDTDLGTHLHRYEYDSTPKTFPQMRQMPTLALFEGVDEVSLHDNSYLLHVFAVPLTREQLALVHAKKTTRAECVRKWFPPGVTVDADVDGKLSAPNAFNVGIRKK